MEIISFRCHKCDEEMRVSADKAGRKAKCKNCGTILTIPGPAARAKAPTSVPPPVPRTTPPPPPTASADDSEDDDQGYSLLEDEITEEQQRIRDEITKLYSRDEDEEEKEKDEDEEEEELSTKRKRRDLRSLRKAPVNTAAWEKVRIGLVVITAGIGFWLFGLLLEKTVLIFAATTTSEYAYIAGATLLDPDETPIPGRLPIMNRAAFMVGLLSGSDLITTGLWLCRSAYILMLVQLLICAIGYGICIVVPPRFGTRGLAITALVLAIINLVLILVLKLLPMTDVLSYTLVPYVAPEVALLPANIERMVPIHAAWSFAPFWEAFAAMLAHIIRFAELVILALFIKAVARSIQDEILQQKADALLRLALGVTFIFMTYLMMINSGTTEVLVNVLRFIYLLWMGFFVWELIWFMLLLMNTRLRIYKAIKYF